MKKFHIVALSTIIAAGTLTVSCQSGGSTSPNASLKNNIDTLSYSYGVQLVEGGLVQYLQQLGVVQDTAMFKMAQMQLISAEVDSVKKTTLEKELAGRIDSLNRANSKNMDLFIKGLQESAGSTGNEQDAYYSGLQIGSQMKNVMIKNFEDQVLVDEGKVNRSAFLAGVIATLKNEKSVVENASNLIQERAMAAQEKVQKKQEEELKKQYTSHIEEGDKFMAENKEKEGIVTLPSGLQYKIIKQGNGEKPTVNDRVKVFYKGTLIDGTEFDGNIGKEPVTFGVGQVIKGWTEALQLMPAGSKWQLFIPYDLAYGGQQAGEKILPFSNLIFDVELISIEK